MTLLNIKNLMGLNEIFSRVKNYKSTADGLAIITLALSFWFKPEYATEISLAIGSIWGFVKIFIQKDK